MYQNPEKRAAHFGTLFVKGLGRSFGSILAAMWDAFGTLCEAFGNEPLVGLWVILGLRVHNNVFFLKPSRCSADILQIMTCIQQVGQIFIQYVLQTWDRVFWSLASLVADVTITQETVGALFTLCWNNIGSFQHTFITR